MITPTLSFSLSFIFFLSSTKSTASRDATHLQPAQCNQGCRIDQGSEAPPITAPAFCQWASLDHSLFPMSRFFLPTLAVVVVMSASSPSKGFVK
ncbi:hypothetical protein BO86DRAFT_77035 [Aspergillus japonicus CBS 114.51]|uniref:Secreted protein n=1 Tax=Aspergillus japonicus CBS 114.51 TaxID=1448312 RepID=A0A8T8XH05_ASPJA|nr:hypothetical protein BO86DRAFT_77035 [Aspergillus japonicus CBS 114.51]RAH87054.1 hypothetical protein BO86DRAFT_77035 [Aspergillus japonicus CBS 114.51]